MKLRHLRYFVEVASRLSFTKAAEALLVAQPALSKQIADLEREIGAPLLFRTKRVVRLTAAGAAFLKDARGILTAADAAKENALRAARGEFGELSIGFYTSPTVPFLPDLIREYRSTYPDVAIRMHELTPDRQLAAFSRGEIDVGFTRPPPPGHPELLVQPLFREGFVAVLSKTHPLASRDRIRIADLARERFVLQGRHVDCGVYDRVISACRAADFSPFIVNAPDLVTTVLTLVAAEQGVSVLPEGVQNLGSKQIVFLPIEPSVDPIPLVLCWREDLDSPHVNEFRRLIDDRVPQLLEEVRG